MNPTDLPDHAHDLFAKIAQENGFENFSVKISSGSQPGDGFTSEIFCIRICEQKSTKQLELVCKIAPSNEHRRKEFSSNQLFKHEILFYREFMPTLQKLQDEKELAKEDQFQCHPKCYGSIIDDENERHIIVLEDLRPHGFEKCDKAKPISIGKARITMRELGKFHGFSIALKDQRPAEFEQFKQVKHYLLTALQSTNMLDLFGKGYDIATQTLTNEGHKNIVRQFRSNILQHFSDCFDGDISDRFGVLCHGDFWANNLLFLRCDEKGAADDIRFLDFQIIFYGSPAIDIFYNIFSSTDKALRDKEYTNLIKLYHESLSKTVKLLGSDPDELFTFEDLLSELKRFGVYALLMSPMLLQVSLAHSNEISNMDEMFDRVAEGESKINLVTELSSEGQSEYHRRLNEVFEDVIQLGYYQTNQES